MRTVVAVILGVVSGTLAIALVERTGHQVYPPPEGLDIEDREAVAELVAAAPIGALLFVLAAWGIGAGVGGWISVRLGSPVPRGPFIVGLVLLAFGVTNMLMIPHPTWFFIAGVLIFLPTALLGGRLAHRSRREDRWPRATG